MAIEDDERAILRTLTDDGGGFATSHVASASGLDLGHSAAVRSARCRARLSAMETKGYVERLDDHVPVAWKRTPAGTLAMGPAPAATATSSPPSSRRAS